MMFPIRGAAPTMGFKRHAPFATADSSPPAPPGASRIEIPAKVYASVGCTPNSIVLISRVSANASDQSGGDSHAGHARALAQHHAQQVGGLGAQRHADTDFVDALVHIVRNDAVDAHRGQHERNRREERRAARMLKRAPISYCPRLRPWCGRRPPVDSDPGCVTSRRTRRRQTPAAARRLAPPGPRQRWATCA